MTRATCPEEQLVEFLMMLAREGRHYVRTRTIAEATGVSMWQTAQCMGRLADETDGTKLRIARFSHRGKRGTRDGTVWWVDLP
jgi:hypothetical protein